ncbi:uncharacterized protein LOC124919889 [Impatiens glandulifera]|uniref:uncharacterized protein LOC124919889 n=1 Tax=Impatiens glandulifera TaxID=253017 RepID=UPI001FB0A6D1|nr:uncharacterized protein LOC124919889 [Impatiens glandulifera]XP_047316211.1 uncharacterized protein LOC124919889 [Impatiens glandulifera]
MGDGDNLASVSEPTADEALIDHKEQVQGGGEDDVGEVMIEVVGSDVFVDGVASDGGSGNRDMEDGGKDEVLKEDTNTKDEVESNEGGNSGQIGAFDSSSRKTCTELKGGFEGMEGVTASSGGQICEEVDNVDKEALASRRADEVQNSEAEAETGSLATSSTRERTHIGVAEEVEGIVVQETRDDEMIEEGLEKVRKSVDEVNGSKLIESISTRPSSVDDKEANPENVIFSAPPVEETSSVQDQVVSKDISVEVVPESSDRKEDFSSKAEDSLVQEAEVTVSEVGMMNKEEITNPQTDLFGEIDDKQQLQADMSSMETEEQDATRDTVGDKDAMVVDQTTLDSDDQQQLQVDMPTMEAEKQDATRDTVGDEEEMTVDQTTAESDDQQQLQVDMSTMEAEKQDANRDTVGDEEEMAVDETTAESDDQKQLQVDMSSMEAEKQDATKVTVGDEEEMIVDQTTLKSGDAIGSDTKDLKSEVFVCAEPHSSNQQTETDISNEMRLDISKDDKTLQIELTLGNGEDHGHSESSTEQVSIIEKVDVAEVDNVEGLPHSNIVNKVDSLGDAMVANTDGSCDIKVVHGDLEVSGEKNEIVDVNDSVAENSEGMKADKFGDTVSDDDMVNRDSSVGKELLGKGNYDPPILKNELCPEIGTHLSDDSKFTEVQPAETLNVDTVVEGHTHTASHVVSASHDVIDSSVSLDEKINSHSSQHTIADVQPSNNDNMEIDSSNIIAEQTFEANIPSSEETGGTFEVEVRDESTVCNLVVDLDTCMNKDGVCHSLDDECKENVSFMDKSHFVDEIQPMESEMSLQVSDGLDGSGTELYFDGYTLEVDVEEECTVLEQLEMEEEEDAGEEQANDGDDIDPKLTNMNDGNIPRLHQPSYLLPPETGEFSVSDLVWGKVKSHPWWPGQIFDSADASDKAMKYHKKDCFLVAYFGDRTFAWNEASVLKPFRAHFSQAERHSSSEALQNAVSCALEEVSRRVELGLACPCLPKDVFDKIEAQIIENAGIREQSSRRPGIDKSMEANSFQADKLLDFVKELAEFPLDGSDGLDLVVAKAQLLALNRQRGYQQLPEFQTCEALQENEMDFPGSADMMEYATEGESKISLKIEKSNSNKRKHNLKDVMYPSKKDRSLSDLMGEERRISFYSAKVSTTSPLTPKPSFKIGDCIRRAASQLTGNTSIVKPNNDAFSIDESTESPMGPDAQNPQGSGSIFSVESSSAAEMLLQLHLVAANPKKGHNSMSALSTFFSGFRNSISVHFSGRQSTGGVRKRKTSHANGSPEEFEFDEVNDSYWAERIIQNGSEELVTPDGQDRIQYQPVILNGSNKSGRRPYTRKRFSNGVPEMPMDGSAKVDLGRKAENAPAELVLNFSENDLVPVETSLNKIFRRFGPIQELETEVDPESCRARVVFKKCSDAEVAFSSAGAFNIFGPMIVNYQLNYTPSPHFKSLPLALLEGQEDAI